MQFYDVAKIIATHGLNGEVKVQVITDFPEERFSAGVKLSLRDTPEHELTVKSGRPFKQFWLIQFTEITDITAAEKLRGQTLVIAENEQHNLPAGAFYYHDILDCTVLDMETKAILGKITDILASGANDVWQITEDTGNEFLIPYIPDVVKKVDVAHKKVYVTLMEGMRNED